MAGYKLSNGLPVEKMKFHYDTIKGRIAETLIHELFLCLGYGVFRYGMENTVPAIMASLRGMTSDTAVKIRHMPDLIVQHPVTKDVFFIEVKFRANGRFSYKDLSSKNDYPYDDAYIILVSKKHIKCVTVAELKKGGEITPESKNYLGYRKEFNLDKDIIVDFCSFAIQFFKDV